MEDTRIDVENALEIGLAVITFLVISKVVKNKLNARTKKSK